MASTIVAGRNRHPQDGRFIRTGSSPIKTAGRGQTSGPPPVAKHTAIISRGKPKLEDMAP